MANPQRENGHTRIANEIMDALVRTRIPGEARQVLDFVIRKTYGFNKKADRIATSQIMEATGLSRRSVEKARNKLREMNLIAVKNGSLILEYTFNKDYESWHLPPKKAHTTAKKGAYYRQKRGQSTPQKAVHKIHKDTITKDNIQNTINQPQAAASSEQPVENPEVTKALDAIYKEGFNIYALINKAKAQLKWGKDQRFPDQVILGVCAAYQKDKPKITNAWPWFTVVLRKESEAFFAAKNIAEHQKIKSQGAMSLAEILSRAQAQGAKT
jgi:phage replication O-like protein O